MFNNSELNDLFHELQNSLEFVGCSDKEILEIEIMIGHNLPKEVKIFFKLLGKKAKGLFTGADYGFDSLEWINNDAKQMLKQNHQPIPKHFLAFLFNQGYSFNAITDFDSDNPSVHLFVDGDEGFTEEITHSTITDYLKSIMKLAQDNLSSNPP